MLLRRVFATRAIEGFCKDFSAKTRLPLEQWRRTDHPAERLYLVAYGVRTPAHARGPMLELVETAAHGEHTGPMLVLAAYHLARFGLLLPLRRIIHTALTTPHLATSAHFNLLLHALAHTPTRSVESANTVVALLNAMDARQLKLHAHTYQALLNDRFVTLQLTKHLHVRMVQEGFVPQASHLEAFLRVFARQGAIHDARRYWELIHTQGGTPRANTLFLNAQDKRSNAFAFLRALAQPETTDREAPPHLHKPPRFLSASHSTIHDLTAALHVAAKDLSTSTHRLVQTFAQIPHPNVVTYTVFIRGLLARKAYPKARSVWEEMEKKIVTSKAQPQTNGRRGNIMKMDNEALTVGLEALTRSGQPHVAFQLLEQYARQPPKDNNDEPSSLLQLTTISYNEFLVALNRISRPDIVLRLFTHQTTLYGVHPNAQSLCILLQAARMACRKDDTLSGALASLKGEVLRGLGRINPIRRYKTYKKRQEREKAVDEVLSALGHPARGGLRAYGAGGSGWGGHGAPADYAREVFLKVVWGMDAESPTEGSIEDVKSPAAAYRASPDDASGSEQSTLGLGLGLGFPSSTHPIPFMLSTPHTNSLLTPLKKSHYPSLIPTNAAFFNYLTLLGVCGRSNEVPLVLAWMRYFGVQPSEATVSVGLVLWAEVSVPSPLVGAWRGVGGGGVDKGNEEYGKLVDWLRDWIGERRLPHWKTLRKWQEVVYKMRTTTDRE